MLKKILSFIILIAFLIPSTGFYYVKHICLQSGYEKIVFSDKFDCCISTEKDHNCCGLGEQQCYGKDRGCPPYKILTNDENCCINIENYLKDDSHYNSPGGKIITAPVYETDIHYTTGYLYSELFTGVSEYKTPPLISSLNILIQTGKLIL